MQNNVAKLPHEIYESIRFKHDVTYYVPVYLVNDGTRHPTFTYSMCEATTDLQMAASYEPYYIMELTGVFDESTPPILDYLQNHGNGD